MAPEKATETDLLAFHDPEYIQALRKNTFSETHGLEHDCPPFPSLWPYVLYTAGGTLACARRLTSGTSDICMHWAGGRHHAHGDKASGYCYVNDCVLGLLELRQVFGRVLYIDVDVHHGDGVERAFYHSSGVFTLSFHHYAPTFFPSRFIIGILHIHLMMDDSDGVPG
jgi:acetoin utilization deacetylase AcuC-like enzyme